MNREFGRLLAVLLFVGSAAMAVQPESDASRFEIYSRWCAGLPSMKGVMVTNDVTGMPEMPVPPEFFQSSLKLALTDLNFLSLTSRLKSVLSDPQFKRALESCFPGDSDTQFYFQAALVQSDFSGKLLAGLGMASTIEAGGALLGAAGRIGPWIARAFAISLTIQLTDRIRHLGQAVWERTHPQMKADREMMALLLGQLALAEKSEMELKTMIADHPTDSRLLQLLSDIVGEEQSVRNDIKNRVEFEKSRSEDFTAPPFVF